MSSLTHVLLKRQIQRVRRRLFMQLCVNRLIVALVAACAAFAVWFLAKPWVLGHSTKPWMDWAVGGLAFALSSAVAIVLAWRKMPDEVAAALALDERFQLRERVTTTLTLSERERVSSAGIALIADVGDRIGTLPVGSKFPVKFGWQSVLVPAAAVALALLIIFYDPAVPEAQGNQEKATPLAAESIKEIEQKKQEFLNRPKAADPNKAERPKGDDVKRIEAQIEEILKKPATTDKEIKDRLSELAPLEEQLKQKEKEEAARLAGFEEQMKKLDQLQKKRKEEGKSQDGPAKDAKEALAQGDTEKAKEEFDRLSKKLKQDELSKKDKEELKKEMQQLKDDLERLAREKDQEKKEQLEKKQQKLEEQLKNDRLDQETKKQLEEELNKTKQEKKECENGQCKQDARELAEKLERAQQALDKGDTDEAATALKDAAEKLERMQQDRQNQEDIENELQRLNDVRESMAKACEKCQGGRDGQDGDAETLSRKTGEQGKESKGGKKGGKGVGRRAENKSGSELKGADARESGKFNDKGTKIHVGTAEGKSVIGKSGASIIGEIKQASQDAPEAIEIQRIPKGYKDSAKGYFKNIGNQQTETPKK